LVLFLATLPSFAKEIEITRWFLSNLQMRPLATLSGATFACMRCIGRSCFQGTRAGLAKIN